MTPEQQTAAMRQALEALESAQGYIEAEHDDRKSLYEPYGMDYKYSTEAEDLYRNKAAITALRRALEQPQEKYIVGTPLLDAMTQGYIPPKREWVGLTDEDLSVCGDEDDVMLARYWERILKEKNT